MLVLRPKNFWKMALAKIVSPSPKLKAMAQVVDRINATMDKSWLKMGSVVIAKTLHGLAMMERDVFLILVVKESSWWKTPPANSVDLFLELKMAAYNAAQIYVAIGKY